MKLFKNVFVVFFSIVVMYTMCSFIYENVTGSGKMAQENRTVPAFSGIDVCCGIEVIVKSGCQSVSVNAEDNVLPLVETEVKDNVLHIGYKNKVSLKTHKKVTVYVSAASIEKLYASSGSKLVCDEVIKGNKLIAKVSSGADMKIAIGVDDFNCEASSGSNMQVSGKANSLWAEASSSGDIDAKNCPVSTATTEASSGSNITVNVSENLIAKASSGGDILYKGAVTKMNKKLSSGGSVKMLN
ncbi:MAG: DUF2807 domain-containing protein [Bacteroidetes bacterium]|nr:DUF2807 domain-containing protein [Bacteroidota bacterium]